MADQKTILESAPEKVPLGDIDEADAERLVTPLQTALAKWEKFFTPEEQAALRAYEAEQGPME